ncbi:MAG: pyruvate kinase [Candidatus Bipolaricaulaceae bacterium]
MKRTKVVATCGPSSADPDVLAAMVEAGMDVARINASHGSAEQQATLAERVRETARSLRRPVGLMLDTPGPAVRVGSEAEPLDVERGDEVLLGPGGVPVTYAGLAEDVPCGTQVLLADGQLVLTAVGRDGRGLRCRVERGGRLEPGKRVNVPGASLRLPFLTAADEEALRLARELDFELVALSFVRSPEDVDKVRRFLGEATPWLVAKVEAAEAVRDMEGVVAAADGAMVARGDLGVEIDPYQVPLVQRRLVDACNAHAKPVIVATQMLRSMVSSPVPTRAEVADVAAAVWDGADAVMLSEETAVGQFPVEAVRVMSRAAQAAEGGEVAIRVPGLASSLVGEVPAAMARAAHAVAQEVDAKAIVCATVSGWTARLVAAFRPRVPVVATTPTGGVPQRLVLVWGVIPLQMEFADDPEALVSASLRAARAAGVLQAGERAVILAGLPFREVGTTNVLRVAAA